MNHERDSAIVEVGAEPLRSPGKSAGPLSRLFLLRLIALYLVVAGTITGLSVLYEFRTSYREVRDSLAVLCDTFSPEASTSLWGFQDELLRTIVDGIGANPWIVFVEVRSVNSAVGVRWHSPRVYAASADLTVSCPLYHIDSDGRKLLLGTMTVSSNDALVAQHVYSSLNVFAVTTFIFLVAMVFSVWLMARYLVTKPLQTFSEEVNRLSGTDGTILFSPQKPDVDEITLLREVFNRQMQHLAEMRRQVEMHNASLEKTVVERTREIMEKEQRFCSIFENANAGIAFADSKGKIILVNAFFASLIGYSIDEVIGLKISDFTHPSDIEMDLVFISEVLRGIRNDFRCIQRCAARCKFIGQRYVLSGRRAAAELDRRESKARQPDAAALARHLAVHDAARVHVRKFSANV